MDLVVYDISQVCGCVFPGWLSSTQCQTLTPTQSPPPVRKASKRRKLKWKNNVTGVVWFRNLKTKSWDPEKIRSEVQRTSRSKYSLWLWLLIVGCKGATEGLKTCRGEGRGRAPKAGQEMKWKTVSTWLFIKTSFFFLYNPSTLPWISVSLPLPRLISPFCPCIRLTSHILSFLTYFLECSSP